MLDTLRSGLRRCAERVRGYKLYAASAAFAAIDVGPEVLNAVGGVDWTPLLPPGWGLKVGGWLAVARLVLPIIRGRMRRGSPPAGGSN